MQNTEKTSNFAGNIVVQKIKIKKAKYSLLKNRTVVMHISTDKHESGLNVKIIVLYKDNSS